MLPSTIGVLYDYDWLNMTLSVSLQLWRNRAPYGSLHEMPRIFRFASLIAMAGVSGDGPGHRIAFLTGSRLVAAQRRQVPVERLP